MNGLANKVLHIVHEIVDEVDPKVKSLDVRRSKEEQTPFMKMMRDLGLTSDKKGKLVFQRVISSTK